MMMQKFSANKNLVCLLACIAISACTTKVEIAYSKTLSEDELNKKFVAVDYFVHPESSFLEKTFPDYPDKFQFIEFVSRRDLRDFVIQKKMHGLGYSLFPCNSDHQEAGLDSFSVYIDDDTYGDNGGYYYYYAPIVKNLQKQIDREQQNYGRERILIPEEVCLRFIAGNIYRLKKLESNSIKVELP